MKVLMVTSTLPRWKGDTVPAFVLELAEKLSEGGLEIMILAPHARSARGYEKTGKLIIKRFYYFFPPCLERLAYGGGVLPNFKKSLLAKMELPFFLLSQFLNVFWTVKSQKIDIVHSHWLLPQGLTNALLRRLIKFRHIVTAHAGMGTKENFFLSRIIKFILNSADAITTNSRWNAELLSAFTRKRIDIIPMGVDTDRFNPLKRDEGLTNSLSQGALMVLGVGRWVEVKGYEYLIMAMAKVVKKINDIKLVLIGFGPEEDRLRKLTAELDLIAKIIFIKGVGRKEINAYFASSDIFILPSISRKDGSSEGFGLSLIEAMSSGIAVIGSRVGGIVDIIKDRETGLLVKEKDPDSLAQRILLLAEDSALRKRLAEQGRIYVRENFSWKKTGEKFHALYKKNYCYSVD